MKSESLLDVGISGSLVDLWKVGGKRTTALQSKAGDVLQTKEYTQACMYRIEGPAFIYDISMKCVMVVG